MDEVKNPFNLQSYPIVGQATFVGAALAFLRPYFLKTIADYPREELRGEIPCAILHLYQQITSNDVTKLFHRLVELLSDRLSHFNFEEKGDTIALVLDVIRLCEIYNPWLGSNICMNFEIFGDCVMCNKKPEIESKKQIELCRDGQIGHDLLQFLGNCTRCESCDTELTIAVYLPKHLLIRYTRKEYKQLHIDLSILLMNVNYTLSSVVLSNGEVASTIAKHDGKWYHFTHTNVTPVSSSHFFFNIPPNHHPLGIFYTLESKENILNALNITKIMQINNINYIPNPYHELPSANEFHLLVNEAATHDLHSRQLSIIGNMENLEKIHKSHVLLVNLCGTSVEIAKNLICIGFKKFTFWHHDLDEKVDASFCEETFCVSLDMIGQKKSETIINYFINRDKEVSVDVTCKPITGSFLKAMDIEIVAVLEKELTIEDGEVASLNEICRSVGVKFVAAHSLGLFIATFIDFGPQPEAYEMVRGSENTDYARANVLSFSVEGDKCVIKLSENIDQFAENDHVTFHSVDGTTVEFEVVCLNKEKNTIQGIFKSDIPNIFDKKGFVSRKPQWKKFSFKTLKESLSGNIQFSNIDYDDYAYDDSLTMFLTYYAITQSENYLKNEKINPTMILEKVQFYLNEGKFGTLTDVIMEEIVINIASTAHGLAPPVITFLGGIITHAIQSALTHRFLPICQWLVFNFTSIFPKDLEISTSKENKEATVGMQRQRLLFGDQVMDIIQDMKILQVGCGATGCETAKILCLMKAGTGKKGHITLSDPDHFEHSNRTRQFVCNFQHVNRPKSIVLCEELSKLHPTFKVTPYTCEVSDQQHMIFSDEFYSQQDVILGTVDSVSARIYLSYISDFHNLAFFECGTEGLTTSNSIFIPKITALYSIPEEVDEQVSCTVKPFPYKDIHAIQWAIDAFEEYFHDGVRLAICHQNNSKETNPGLLDNVTKYINVFITLSKNPENLEPLVTLTATLFNDAFFTTLEKQIEEVEQSIDEIKWTETKLKPNPSKFSTANPLHMQLLHDMKNIFLDMLSSKLTIHPLKFDKDNKKHLQFVSTIAQIRCICFGILFKSSIDRVQRVAGLSPSIITSTAVSASYNCLMIYLAAFSKIYNLQKESLRELRANLSVSSFVLNPVRNYYTRLFSLIIDQNITVGDVKTKIKEHLTTTGHPLIKVPPFVMQLHIISKNVYKTIEDDNELLVDILKTTKFEFEKLNYFRIIVKNKKIPKAREPFYVKCQLHEL